MINSGLWFVVCGLWKIKNLVQLVKDKIIYPKKKYLSSEQK
jgi:hypothetical protein